MPYGSGLGMSQVLYRLAQCALFNDEGTGILETTVREIRVIPMATT